MPFTAVCPHCREAKLKAPFAKRGKLVDCPRCGEPFMLIPENEHDAPLVDYDLAAPRPGKRKKKAEPEPLAAPTEPAIAAQDPTAPVTTDPTTTAPLPESVAPTQFAVPDRPRKDHDIPLRFALVGIGLVGVAVVASQFPYGRIIGTVLAAVGVLLGGLSLLGLEKRPWLGYAGMGLNAVALVFLVLLPNWLGISEWTPQGNPDAAPKPVTAVGRDGSLPKPVEWVDANKAVWEQGDVRIAVTSVSIGPADPEVSRPPGLKRETVLRIGLKLTNVGVARVVEFKGWTEPPPGDPKLTTAAGKPLAYKNTGLPNGAASVYPGKSTEFALTFEPPAGAPADYRLELPAQAFGGTDPVKFQIPQTMFRGRLQP